MGEEAGTGWVGFWTCRSLGREYGAGAWGGSPTWGDKPRVPGKEGRVSAWRETVERACWKTQDLASVPVGSKEPAWTRDGRWGPEPLGCGGLHAWPRRDHGQAPHVALLATGFWAVEWEKQMGTGQ